MFSTTAEKYSAWRANRDLVFAQQWRNELRPHPWRFIFTRGILLCGLPMAVLMWSSYFLAPPSDRQLVLGVVLWCMPVAAIFGLIMGAVQWFAFEFGYRKLSLEQPIGHHAP